MRMRLLAIAVLLAGACHRRAHDEAEFAVRFVDAARRVSIPPDMVDAFAVSGEPGEIPARIVERYGDMVTRVSFYAPYRMERAQLRELLAGFRA